MFKRPNTKAYVDLVSAIATLIARAMNAAPPVPPAGSSPDFDSVGDLFQMVPPPPVRLTDAIAATANLASPGRVEHAEVEAEAREKGVRLDVPPVLVSHVELQP